MGGGYNASDGRSPFVVYPSSTRWDGYSPEHLSPEPWSNINRTGKYASPSLVPQYASSVAPKMRGQQLVDGRKTTESLKIPVIDVPIWFPDDLSANNVKSADVTSPIALDVPAPDSISTGQVNSSKALNVAHDASAAPQNDSSVPEGEQHREHSTSSDVTITEKTNTSVQPASNEPHVLDEQLAATKLQAALRGYFVRCSKPLKQLQTVAAVKSDMEAVQRQLADAENLKKVRSDGKEKLRVSEKLLSMLLRLDTVQGSHVAEVVQARKATARQIVVLMDSLEAPAAEDAPNVESSVSNDGGAETESKAEPASDPPTEEEVQIATSSTSHDIGAEDESKAEARASDLPLETASSVIDQHLATSRVPAVSVSAAPAAPSENATVGPSEVEAAEMAPRMDGDQTSHAFEGGEGPGVAQPLAEKDAEASTSEDKDNKVVSTVSKEQEAEVAASHKPADANGADEVKVNNPETQVCNLEMKILDVEEGVKEPEAGKMDGGHETVPLEQGDVGAGEEQRDQGPPDVLDDTGKHIAEEGLETGVGTVPASDEGSSEGTVVADEKLLRNHSETVAGEIEVVSADIRDLTLTDIPLLEEEGPKEFPLLPSLPGPLLSSNSERKEQLPELVVQQSGHPSEPSILSDANTSGLLDNAFSGEVAAAAPDASQVDDSRLESHENPINDHQCPSADTSSLELNQDGGKVLPDTTSQELNQDGVKVLPDATAIENPIDVLPELCEWKQDAAVGGDVANEGERVAVTEGPKPTEGAGTGGNVPVVIDVANEGVHGVIAECEAVTEGSKAAEADGAGGDVPVGSVDGAVQEEASEAKSTSSCDSFDGQQILAAGVSPEEVMPAPTGGESTEGGSTEGGSTEESPELLLTGTTAEVSPEATEPVAEPILEGTAAEVASKEDINAGWEIVQAKDGAAPDEQVLTEVKDEAADGLLAVNHALDIEAGGQVAERQPNGESNDGEGAGQVVVEQAMDGDAKELMVPVADQKVETGSGAHQFHEAVKEGVDDHHGVTGANRVHEEVGVGAEAQHLTTLPAGSDSSSSQAVAGEKKDVPTSEIGADMHFQGMGGEVRENLKEESASRAVVSSLKQETQDKQADTVAEKRATELVADKKSTEMISERKLTEEKASQAKKEMATKVKSSSSSDKSASPAKSALPKLPPLKKGFLLSDPRSPPAAKKKASSPADPAALKSSLKKIVSSSTSSSSTSPASSDTFSSSSASEPTSPPSPISSGSRSPPEHTPFSSEAPNALPPHSSPKSAQYTKPPASDTKSNDSPTGLKDAGDHVSAAMVEELRKQNDYLRQLLEQQSSIRAKEVELASRQAAMLQSLQDRLHTLEDALRSSGPLPSSGPQSRSSPAGQLSSSPLHALPAQLRSTWGGEDRFPLSQNAPVSKEAPHRSHPSVHPASHEVPEGFLKWLAANADNLRKAGELEPSAMTSPASLFPRKSPRTGRPDQLWNDEAASADNSKLHPSLQRLFAAPPQAFKDGKGHPIQSRLPSFQMGEVEDVFGLGQSGMPLRV